MYYSYVEAEHYSLVFLANQNTPERPLAPVCSEFDTKDQLVWEPLLLKMMMIDD